MGLTYYLVMFKELDDKCSVVELGKEDGLETLLRDKRWWLESQRKVCARTIASHAQSL